MSVKNDVLKKIQILITKHFKTPEEALCFFAKLEIADFKKKCNYKCV